MLSGLQQFQACITDSHIVFVSPLVEFINIVHIPDFQREDGCFQPLRNSIVCNWTENRCLKALDDQFIGVGMTAQNAGSLAIKWVVSQPRISSGRWTPFHLYNVLSPSNRIAFFTLKHLVLDCMAVGCSFVSAFGSISRSSTTKFTYFRVASLTWIITYGSQSRPWRGQSYHWSCQSSVTAYTDSAWCAFDDAPRESYPQLCSASSISWVTESA